MDNISYINKSNFYKNSNYYAQKLNPSHENFHIVNSLINLKTKHLKNEITDFLTIGSGNTDVIEIYKNEEYLTTIGCISNQVNSELFTILHPLKLNEEDHKEIINILNHFKINNVNPSVSLKCDFLQMNNKLILADDLNENTFIFSKFANDIYYLSKFNNRHLKLIDSEFLKSVHFQNINLDLVKNCTINFFSCVNCNIQNINNSKFDILSLNKTIIQKNEHINSEMVFLRNSIVNDDFHISSNNLQINLNNIFNEKIYFKGRGENSQLHVENNISQLNKIEKIDCQRIYLYGNNDNNEEINKLILNKLSSRKWNFKTISFNQKVYNYDHFYLLRKEKLNLKIK